MFLLGRRGLFLGISLSIFIISIYVISRAMSSSEKLAKSSDIGIGKELRYVQVENFERGEQGIRVNLYGTVEAGRKLVLRAPFETKVLKTIDIERGMLIPAGEELMSLDTTRLDFAIESLKIEQRGLQMRERQEEHLLGSLKERRRMMEEMVEIAAASLKVHQKKYEIQKKMFEKSKALYATKVFSDSQFLERELLHQQAQLDWDGVRKAYLAQVMSLAQIDEELGCLQTSVETLGLRMQNLALTLAEKRYEREKAFVSVDFPVRLGKVLANTGDYLQLGQELMQVLSADESIVELNLPDHYLRWIQRENYLNGTYPLEEGKPSIQMTQMVGDDERVFSGAYLKAIGEALNEPMGSLPLIVARPQPLNGGKDTLLPGTYVKVTIELLTLNKVYSLPSQALQEGNCLFSVEDGEKKGEHVLHVFNPEILHRDTDRIIVSFPVDHPFRQIVVHRVKDVFEGMPVKVER